jgi:hypothetical protein
MAFYPTVRGPYNFTTTGINTDGTLQNPQSTLGRHVPKAGNKRF